MVRKHLTACAAALLASAALFAAKAASAEEIRLAVGCPAVPQCADWVWAEDVAKQLNEAGLEAKVYVGGALGKDPELVDQLSQGLLQFALTNFVMINEVDPRVQGFITPYMFDDMPHMFRALEETDLLAPISAKMEEQGVKIAALTGLGGTVGFFNTKKPIEKPADFEGLRMRAIDSSQMELLKNWGASGVVVDMPEFTTSVQQGMVDGYVNPPAVAFIFKHTDFLKYYTDAGAGTPFRSALMSKDWYDGLSAEDRAKVDEAVRQANLRNREWTEKAAAQELTQLEKLGVTVTELTPEARAEFVERARKTWPLLMPADSVDAFVAAAEKTRK
ncbi:TRAP transporter substrate-binding protein [Mesorhizobium sp. 1B3]|uniref:TRAP transporter substrate-binding protein n=1 Tax=Mesorhizobium sp. 1B3 TaxID=3243599 RepID=UPI003D975AFC